MNFSFQRMATGGAIAALMAAAGLAVPAQAETMRATYGSIFAPGVPIVRCGALPMAEDQALKDAGFDVTVIHSAQLGSENQLAEQIASGELEMSTITSSILAAWVENMAVLETYYLYDNVDQAMKVYTTDTAKELLAELLKVANIRVIGQPWLYGERNVFGKKEIKGPDDFKGLRMRVPETYVSIEGAKSLGADPTPVAYAELYLALQQGIVDAAEAPLAVIAAESFDEPADYVMMTRHLITAQPFVVNEDFWQSLSPEQQAALDKAATEGSERVRACASEADAAALETWAAEGQLKVVEDLDREAIKARSQAYFSEGFPFSETYKALLTDLK